MSANLNPIDGKRVEAALTERRDARFAEAADADADAGDEGCGECGAAATWADALIDVAERSLDDVESRPRRDRYRTWMHVEVGSGAVTTTDGWRIPMGLADEILCDGVLQPVWERDGLPFSVGRAQHIVPDRTRRVIERRDRGCRVPGCSNDRFVEVHHIVRWTDGGPTSTWNLCALCPRHHKLHHRGEFAISGNADQIDGLVFRDAEGRVIAGREPPVSPTGPPPSPTEPYRTPVNERMNWHWLTGWEHPNATERRLEQIEAARITFGRAA